MCAALSEGGQIFDGREEEPASGVSFISTRIKGKKIDHDEARVIVGEKYGREMRDAFLQKLAALNGRIFTRSQLEPYLKELLVLGQAVNDARPKVGLNGVPETAVTQVEFTVDGEKDGLNVVCFRDSNDLGIVPGGEASHQIISKMQPREGRTGDTK